jgi:outer membrane lipoprotein-sorting protein
MKAPAALFQAVILCSILFSCAKAQEEAASPRGIDSRPDHPAIVGSLDSNLKAIVSSSYAEACDKDHQKIHLEIAQELDQRKEEIILKAKKNRSENLLGNLTIDSQYAGNTNTAIEKDQWITHKKSWGEIRRMYEIVKGKPTDARWAYLDEYFQAILIDDQNRVEYGANYYLEKDSGPNIEALLQAVEFCHYQSDCTYPEISSLHSFIETQPYYKYFLNQLIDQPGLKISTLLNFSTRLRVDYYKYSFQKNDGISRTQEDVFHLPLDGKSYNGDLTSLAISFSSYWQEASAQLANAKRPATLNVDWTQIETNPKAFRFEFSPNQGRAHVLASEKLIRIFMDQNPKVIAHEIGHVLGFRDSYYTHWNPSTCEYTYQYRNDDIMSNHLTGSVLAHHWEDLRKHYPVKQN